MSAERKFKPINKKEFEQYLKAHKDYKTEMISRLAELRAMRSDWEHQCKHLTNDFVNDVESMLVRMGYTQNRESLVKLACDTLGYTPESEEY